MQDPFPIPPIPALSQAVQPFADFFGLHTLPLHIHEVLAAAALYTFVQLVVSPVVSRFFVPHLYNNMSRSKRANWDAHVVSIVQSMLINCLSLWCIAVDDDRRAIGGELTHDPATQLVDGGGWRGRIYGYTPGSAVVQSMATGYFLWDLALTATYLDVFGIGLLAHASSALAVYSFGFRPFLNYYGCNFILYELSTPFLNVHWFMDKLEMTGSRAQLYNGIVLICTFFCCRLIYGNYMSAWVYADMWRAVWEGPGDAALPTSRGSSVFRFAGTDPIPMWLFVTYTTSNLILNSLNVIWFFKMIAAVRKRFEPKAKPAKDEKTEEKPAVVATAVDSASPVARLRAMSNKFKVEDDFTEVQ